MGFCCFIFRTGVVPEVFSGDFVFALIIWPPDYMMYKVLGPVVRKPINLFQD